MKKTLYLFPLNIDDKEYLVTYDEENKYSKREIIEWYKFSYSRNRWELISSHDIAKEINLFLVGKLMNLCFEYNISLDSITNDLTDYLNEHMITYNHLEQLKTFFILAILFNVSIKKTS